jgi:hypothetical protein
LKRLQRERFNSLSPTLDFPRTRQRHRTILAARPVLAKRSVMTDAMKAVRQDVEQKQRMELMW